VRALPTDEQAAAEVRAWADSSGDTPLDVAGLDLTGADLTGADLAVGLFTEAVLRHVPLRGADLYRANLEGADLAGADLFEASLVKAVLDEAVLGGARLDRADLGSASLWGVDAHEASLRGASLDGASLIRTVLTGADLSGATVAETSFRVVLDDRTVVTGLSGTVFGPATAVEGEDSRELTGAELERWLNDRGARIQVLAPKRPG
jgi:uncharacterized protein YjbI with pentapeptide repeats